MYGFIEAMTVHTLATVSIMGSEAIFRMGTGFYIGFVVWSLRISLSTIRVLSACQKYYITVAHMGPKVMWEPP